MNQLIRYFFCFPEDEQIIGKLKACFSGAQLTMVENCISLTVRLDLKSASELTETLDRILTCDKELEEEMDQLIGYSTLFLNTENWNEAPFWLDMNYAETRLRCGSLRFSVAKGLSHIFAYSPLGMEKINQFAEDFRDFDLKVFKTGYQTLLFRERLETIICDQKDIEQTVEQILYNYSGGQKTDEEQLGLWEKNIQDLAGVFSALGGYLPVIKRMETTLSQDIDSLYKAMRKFKEGVPDNDPLVMLTIGWVKNRVENIRKIGDDLAVSRDNAFTAMNVVQTKVSLARAREELVIQEQMGRMLEQNVGLQREGVALQVSAAFIEFIVVNYYSLSVWKTVAPAEAFYNIPGWLKLATVVLFAAAAVLCTHFTAEKMLHKSEKAGIGLIASIAALLGIFGFMVALTLVY